MCCWRVIAVVSYRVLAYQLDADATANLTELTSGLHGYLRFPDDLPTVVFDQTDPEQAAFVQEATRYYQIYDARTGELLVQSDALRPLGLEFTPGGGPSVPRTAGHARHGDRLRPDPPVQQRPDSGRQPRRICCRWACRLRPWTRR